MREQEQPKRAKLPASTDAQHATVKQGRRMKVLISGSSGLIGSALAPFLTAGGHSVGRLIRRAGPSGGAEIFWDSETGLLDPARLEGFDGVVHLAGESISG